MSIRWPLVLHAQVHEKDLFFLLHKNWGKGWKANGILQLFIPKEGKHISIYVEPNFKLLLLFQLDRKCSQILLNIYVRVYVCKHIKSNIYIWHIFLNYFHFGLLPANSGLYKFNNLKISTKRNKNPLKVFVNIVLVYVFMYKSKQSWWLKLLTLLNFCKT